ncbi:MAG: ABC transporter permease [Blastocatellia bacterium]
METILQDIRYGIRMLIKNPGFTVVAVLVLALGIGANSVIFSAVNALLLNTFSYSDPEQLVGVWERAPQNPLNEVAPANFIDWQKQNEVFSQIGALNFWNANLTGVDVPERLQGFQVSPGLISLLGVAPLIGRDFLPEEAELGKNTVVIISHGLWQRRFGGDPDIIGKTLNINNRDYTVIAVMPPGFQVHRKADLWSPLALRPTTLANRQSHFLIVMARLKTGVTREQAQAAMTTIAGQLQQQYPETNTNWGANVVTLQEQTVGQIKPAALVLLVAVGLVLLIACANVANLLLARAATRQKEIAIRLALGSSRRRIVRQLLTESLLLALLGGLAGLLLAMWSVDILVANVPEDVAFSLPRLKEIGINLPVLGFTLLVSLATGMVFGLAPAFQASRFNLNDVIKEGGRGTSTGLSGRRLRQMLVIAEVALSAVLLIGASLLIKSMLKLLEVNPGFSGRNVITMRTTLPGAKYREDAQMIAFYNQITERLEQMPGVESAGAISHLPMGGSNSTAGFDIEGKPAPSPADQPEAAHRAISTEYFRVLNIPIIQGRQFTAEDNETAPGVVIVSASLARRYFPGEDPVGKRIKLEDKGFSVVGIVGDVKHGGLDKEAEPTMYFTYRQQPYDSMVLLVRAAANPMSLMAAMRSAVLAVDKDQPVYEIRTIDDAISESITLPRYTAVLLSVFAAIALLLAAVGLYGVMSYVVTGRTHEIGIRMALGARTGDVLRLIVGQGLSLALIGLAIGVVAAFALTRLMSSMLYGVSATDTAIFLLVSALLAGVALLACAVPARRATKVDPMVALRYE